MKKKNLISILVLALAFIFLITACSSKPANGNSGADDASGSDTSASADNNSGDDSSDSSDTVTAAEVGQSRPIAEYEDIPTFEDLEIPEGETIHIGYISQTETFQFCVNMSTAMKAEVEKYGDQVEFELYDARSIAANQVSLAEDLIAKQVDVAIISCIDQEASAPAVQKLADAGIPVISVNTLVANHDVATAYIGVDDSEAGRLQVQLMAEALGNEGTINVMKGLLGDPANEKRLSGVEAEIENSGLEIGSAQAADWDRGKAMTLTEDWITSGREFNGIICLNDEMAVSTINALKAAGVDVPVIGIDAIEEALALVKSGDMYATLFQNPFEQGAGAINLAVAAALGVDVSYDYLIPFEVITADNVDDIAVLYEQYA